MERQLVGLQDLAHVQARQGNFGRARQIEAVVADLVVLGLLRGEEAGAVHGFFPNEHRRQHRREPFGDEPVEREAVEREREERGTADDVAEARPREPRTALHVVAGELEVVLYVGQLRVLAHLANDFGLLLRRAVGDGFVRRVRHGLESSVTCLFGLGQLALEALQVLLDLLELLDLLRSRLALELLPATELVHLRDELTPAGVRLEQPVEGLALAFARDRRPQALGLGASGPEVDHV